MSATDRYTEAPLSIKQERALEALLSGSTHNEAARAAEVNRVTVTRWSNYDPKFMAELNRRRVEAFANGGHRLRGALLSAVEVVAKALEGPEPSVTAALALLRLGGYSALIDAARIGPSTADAILDEEVERVAACDLLGSLRNHTPDKRREVEAHWAVMLPDRGST